MKMLIFKGQFPLAVYGLPLPSPRFQQSPIGVLEKSLGGLSGSWVVLRASGLTRRACWLRAAGAHCPPAVCGYHSLKSLPFAGAIHQKVCACCWRWHGLDCLLFACAISQSIMVG